MTSLLRRLFVYVANITFVFLFIKFLTNRKYFAYIKSPQCDKPCNKLTGWSTHVTCDVTNNMAEHSKIRYKIIFPELALLFLNLFRNGSKQCKAHYFLFSFPRTIVSISKRHTLFKHSNHRFEVMQNFS